MTVSRSIHVSTDDPVLFPFTEVALCRMDLEMEIEQVKESKRSKRQTENRDEDLLSVRTQDSGAKFHHVSIH